MFSYRPYQNQIFAAVEAGFQQFSRQLVVAPTGSGKTVIFSELARRRAATGKRSLILAHREELIDQAIDKLAKSTGLVAEKEKAEHWASLKAKVVVGSVQTMRGERLLRWPKNHFSLVIADEAHHSISAQWQQTLQHFDAQVLGVTATPDRGDARNLGCYYENIAFEVGLFDLIRDGYLSQIVIKSLPLQIDVTQVNQTAGDYDASELGNALEPYLGAIARAIREHAGFRRTLAFLPLIRTSRLFVEACRSVGLAAEHVDGTSEDRRAILQRFAAGEFDILSNAMLLTEGYDDPGIDCIVNLRPTRSRSLYSQITGRGTRVSPHKENLLLLDFLWAHTRHSLMRPAHLVAKSDDEAEVITKLAEVKAGGQQEALELEALATEASEARHESLRKALEKNKNKKAKTVSADEYALAHGAADICDYEARMKWEGDRVTEPQARALKRAGIDPATVKDKGHATKLLHVHFASQKLVLASPKQVALMRRMGHPNAEQATADDARKFMASLRR